jgi:hypothetical protein
MTPEQEAKLPRYARWELEKLRADRDHYEKLAVEAEAGFMKRGAINVGDYIFDWAVRGSTELVLSAHDGILVIVPQAANSVTLYNRPFGRLP